MEIELLFQKSNVKVEDMPQIQECSSKIIVVKYGGSAMIDEELKKNVIEDVVSLKNAGFKPIIVHGGGKEINKWVNKLGIKNTFVNGLRVTDAQTMEIAEMVLSKLNKQLVKISEGMGVKAVGISGKDGGTIKVIKRYVNDLDIGYVGKITKVDTTLMMTLMDNDFIPIISPIGLDEQFQEYNINADDVACAVATAVKAEKLVFLTDIEGVCRDPKDSSTLISELTVPEARKFLDSGNAGGGMLPKLINCIDAVENGVSRVHILDGRIQHSLLLEFFTNKNIGTMILNC
ncbi:MAG: acetylglutamate kinase [Sedimentibacter sp.]|uniref:acetylglutamate kinase n=1 Tax=Sedimentibacter sp. TaxID=1960295 RepID=UPI002980AD16|nr:acetylglutamate kinase [Sedimentibacter sp.]MDW5299043.1 acetylglutamate kinase [Sedimentibacter sp.]